MAAASVSGFDRRQAAYWERDQSYTDPLHVTAVAAARPKIEFVQHVLELPRSATVLDVGAGNGVFSCQLCERFDRVTSVDVAWNMIVRNPAHGHKLQCSAYELPFSAGSFDLVFCGNLLHHVGDPLRVAREMARVAGSYVVFCEPNRWNLPLWAYMALIPEERGGVKFRPAYVRGLARAAGLQVRACESMGLVYERSTPPFMLPWLRAFDRPVWFGAYTVLVGQKWS